MKAVRLGWTLGGVLVGCGPIVGGSDDVDGSTTGGTTTASPSSSSTEPDPTVADVATGVPPNPATTDDPDTTSDPDSGSESTTAIFIIDPDGPTCFTHCSQCDVWAQDCPRGEKCNPWANDGGNAWNATRCSPIGEDEVGDPCTVEGSGVSGVDSCVLGAMCWNVDPETNMGECVGFCEGTRANPECPGACDTCTISNEGVLILCLPQCNPVSPDCGADQSCLTLDGATFICVPSSASAQLGEVCVSDGDCVAGLRCAPAGQLPACDGASCCAPWCDPIAMDPCAALPGTTCVTAVPGVPGCTPDVGACLLPG